MSIMLGIPGFLFLVGCVHDKGRRVVFPMRDGGVCWWCTCTFINRPLVSCVSNLLPHTNEGIPFECFMFWNLSPSSFIFILPLLTALFVLWKTLLRFWVCVGMFIPHTHMYMYYRRAEWLSLSCTGHICSGTWGNISVRKVWLNYCVCVFAYYLSC